MSDEKRYLYAIGSEFRTNAPMLVRAAVIAAGPKRVMTESTSLAFGCRSKHDADRVSWTPDVAWDAFIANQERRIESAKEHIARAESLIEQSKTRRMVEAVDDERGY